jgi:hypothetical protein
MSVRRSAVRGILALAMLSGGCHQSTPPNNNHQTTDECGDIKAAVFPVINGVLEPDPDVANLSESQQLAVGALLINYGMAMCSATLVAPNVVLTAAHCIDFPISTISFIGGRDLRSPDFTFAATEWHEHPEYSGNYPEFDIAIILISGDTAAQGITPIPVNLETTRIVGETVQTVGYGETREGGGYNTERWWTTLYINMESTFYRSTYGDALTGMCQGDSGGPMLYTMPDGIVYVMGPLSSGDDDSCLGHDFYPRTDFYADFIESYLPQDPCEGETLPGRCDGQTAVWCEAGAVVRDDCASRGYLCGDDGTGSFRCAAPPDPCAGETYEGRCDGRTAVWCEAGTVSSVLCGEGMLCGALEDGLSRCIDECTLIGRAGRCDENGRARWCEDGVLRVRDCVFCGLGCGWVDDNLGYYCL